MAFRPDRLMAETKSPTAREKKSVFRSTEGDPRHLRARHAAKQHRHYQHRDRCEQSIKCMHRGGRQFARHHVVALEIRQEKQAKGALAFLLAQAIGCVPDALEEAIEQFAGGNDGEQPQAALPGR